jgi:hypothetical protein
MTDLGATTERLVVLFGKRVGSFTQPAGEIILNRDNLLARTC